MYKIYTSDWIWGSIELTTSEDTGWDFAKPIISLNKFTGKRVYIKVIQLHVDTPTKEIEKCVNKLQNEIIISAIRKYFPNIPEKFDRVRSFQYTFFGKNHPCSGTLIDCTI